MTALGKGECREGRAGIHGEGLSVRVGVLAGCECVSACVNVRACGSMSLCAHA